MKYAKRILGYLLALSPLFLAFAVIWLTNGLVTMLISAALQGVLMGALWLGLRLIENNQP